MTNNVVGAASWPLKPHGKMHYYIHAAYRRHEGIERHENQRQTVMISRHTGSQARHNDIPQRYVSPCRPRHGYNSSPSCGVLRGQDAAPSKRSIKTLFSLLIFALAYNCHAQIFSPVNRFRLSDPYLDTLRERVLTEDAKYFYSLPSLKPTVDSIGSLRAVRGGDTLAVRPSAVGAFEAGEGIAPFLVMRGDIGAKVAALEAYVQYTAYTCDTLTREVPSRVEYERLFPRNTEHISGAFLFGMNLAQAYATVSLKSMSLSVGKKKIRWGPGYAGTLGLSGSGFAPFSFYNGRVVLGERIAFSFLLAGLDDHYSYRDEARGDSLLNSIIDDSPRYVTGHRLDVIITEHVQAGIYEFADFFGSRDIARYANPLQLYYVSQAMGSSEVNLLGGCDINVIVEPMRFYAEFLNDDITVFDDAGNPNKFALQLGAVAYPKGRLRQCGIEYTHVAPYVYGNSRPLSRHAYWGRSLGWPWGNDQDLFLLHGIVDISPILRTRLELEYRLDGKGRIRDDWNDDGRPDLDVAPYFPRDAAQSIAATLGATFTPRPWARLDATYRPSWDGSSVGHEFYGYLSLALPVAREVSF